MRIEIASLDGGKGEFAHSYAPGELVLEDERLRLIEPPMIEGHIRRDGQKVKANGSVVARVEVECDRCLKPIELPVDVKFKLEYLSAADYQAQNAAELAEDDLDVAVFDGEVIDIDALVSEELMLAVPDHVLCRDDCKGMCPVCGIDRNAATCNCEAEEVDARWAGLKELINRENG